MTDWRATEPYLPDRNGALVGYAGRLVADPGTRLPVHVSSDVGDYDAALVALDRPSLAGRWTAATDGATLPLGRFAGRRQLVVNGSCVIHPAPDRHPDHATALDLWTWPTLPRAGHEQTIASLGHAGTGSGLWLGLDRDGCLLARVGTEAGAIELRGPRCVEREWLHVTVALDPRSSARLRWSAPSRWVGGGGGHVEVALAGPVRWADAPTCFGATPLDGASAARGPLERCFNGKVARPTLRAGDGSVLAAWALHDAGNGLHRNSPALAVTGPEWSRQEIDPRLSPTGYDAAHFHEDDVEDAGWDVAFELEIPAEAGSGVYGVLIEGDGGRDVVPFVVAPSPRRAPAALALWLPTYTYLAYANQRRGPGEAEAFATRSLLDEEAVQPSDEILAVRPDLGLSLYDCHRDGSPCRYSSALRPIANLRPGELHRHTGRPRGFSGDLRFLRRLAARSDALDVITDETVQAGGVNALLRHRVVVTGSHPEYVTGAMHKATEDYVRRGGRMLYLGGNGFYWVTGTDDRRPHLIEVRRGHGGENPTGDSPPGESHLSTTGEFGGLWRHRGRPPQLALGLGMAGMGWGAGDGYAWTPAADDPAVAFVSAGVDRAGPLGAGTEEHPWGAATDEIDRADVGLGTPLNATLLATSVGRYDDRMGASASDVASGGPRADIVYAESEAGGRLFAVGAMGWTDAFEACPDVERVTLNVLREFLDSTDIV